MATKAFIYVASQGIHYGWRRKIGRLPLMEIGFLIGNVCPDVFHGISSTTLICTGREKSMDKGVECEKNARFSSDSRINISRRVCHFVFFNRQQNILNIRNTEAVALVRAYKTPSCIRATVNWRIRIIEILTRHSRRALARNILVYGLRIAAHDSRQGSVGGDRGLENGAQIDCDIEA